MFSVPNFEIMEFGDPICIWCWGSEPILKRIETIFPKKIKITYITSGLIEDIRTYRDDENNIGGDISLSNQNLAKYWFTAAKNHKMPVCTEGLKIFSEKCFSSYPANIAYHAAKIQSEKTAIKYMQRLREAVFTESSQITNPKVLIELAKDVGLKIGDFIIAMEDGTAERLFYEDQFYTKLNKITTFPTYIIRNNFNGKSITLTGYQDYETFKAILEYLADDDLIEVKKEKTLENIIKYLEKEKKIALIEIKEVFDLTDKELDFFVNLLKAKDYISIEDLSVNSFIYYMGKARCDEQTCEF